MATVKPSRRSLLAALALLLGATGCPLPPRDTGFDAEKLCALQEEARRTNDRAAFLAAVRHELGVPSEDVRFDQHSALVRTASFFVEEVGWYIAGPGAEIPGNYEPGFEHVRACVYRYRFAG